MAGEPPYATPPPPLPPTGYSTPLPPPPSSSPTTHVTVIVIVVPIVGAICLGLLAALPFVFCRRRRRFPEVVEQAKVDEVEDVEVVVTEHVRIVEGVVGEAGEVEVYKQAGGGGAYNGCGGGVVEEAVAAGVVVQDDVKVEEHGDQQPIQLTVQAMRSDVSMAAQTDKIGRTSFLKIYLGSRLVVLLSTFLW